MPFQKGHVANPTGRPRKTDEQRKFEENCRNWASKYGFQKLTTHAESEDKDVFKWAISEIFNRGFGKAVEVVEANVTAETGHSIEELAKEAAGLLGAGEGKDSGLPTPPQVDPGK